METVQILRDEIDRIGLRVYGSNHSSQKSTQRANFDRAVAQIGIGSYSEEGILEKADTLGNIHLF